MRKATGKTDRTHDLIFRPQARRAAVSGSGSGVDCRQV